MKKKTVAILVALSVITSLTGCGAKKADAPATNDTKETAEQTETTKEVEDSKATGEEVTIKLGVMGASDETIWNPIVEEFKEKGVNIEYVFFTDYTQPNAALANGDVDLNAFQTYSYLQSEKETFGYNITDIGFTLITALNLYSKNITDVKDLTEGSSIVIPADQVSGPRAYKVLAGAGLIELDDSKNPGKENIVSNPLNFEFVEVDPSQTASLLPDVTAGFVNGAFALDAGLSPKGDSIVYDDPNYYTTDDYKNVIAVRTEDKDKELYKEIVEAYQTQRTADIYINEFDSLYVPAWE